MMYENHSPVVRQASCSVPPTNSASSTPTTPNFVRKFRSNFLPLDLRKITLYGSQSISIEEPTSASTSASASISHSSNSSQENIRSPRDRRLVSASFHSNSHDSFMLKRQTSQTKLRESLLRESLLSPRTKEVKFTVPDGPVTPTFGRKVINSGDSSPNSQSGSRSETEQNPNSRANTPSPIPFLQTGRTSALGSPRTVSAVEGYSSGACSLATLAALGFNPELYKTKPETEDDEEYPPNHIGRVWYSLDFEPTSERLLVTLIKARNLPESRNKPCNPIVRITLHPDDRRPYNTKPKNLTSNPEFNESFRFQTSQASMTEGRTLKMYFFDFDDVTKRQTMIGYVAQPLKDVDWSAEKKIWKEDLVTDMGELSPNSEVFVSLSYNGTISRLTLAVLDAKGIKSKDCPSGMYLKVYLSENTKLVKKKKTEAIPLDVGCRACFNQSFIFKLTQEILETTSIEVKLMYNMPGYNKDKIAGRIVFGNKMFARGKGLLHWNEMMSKQKEQIKQWHPIEC